MKGKGKGGDKGKEKGNYTAKEKVATKERGVMDPGKEKGRWVEIVVNTLIAQKVRMGGSTDVIQIEQLGRTGTATTGITGMEINPIIDGIHLKGKSALHGIEQWRDELTRATHPPVEEFAYSATMRSIREIMKNMRSLVSVSISEVHMATQKGQKGSIYSDPQRRRACVAKKRNSINICRV